MKTFFKQFIGSASHWKKILNTKLVPNQGLLELLWEVYSEVKLQSCLQLRNFQNPFNKDKSIDKAGPGFDEIP